MYNGVGLQTARGSGTSGYVQRNLSHVLPGAKTKNDDYGKFLKELMSAPQPLAKPPNQELISHEKKRQIEAKVFSLGKKLRAEGTLEEGQIKTRLARERQRLQDELQREQQKGSRGSARMMVNLKDKHQAAMAKQEHMDRLKDALKISDNFQAGAAFDLELQERKREERLARKDQERKDRKRQRKEEKRARQRAELQKQLMAVQQVHNAVEVQQSEEEKPKPKTKQDLEPREEGEHSMPQQERLSEKDVKSAPSEESKVGVNKSEKETQEVKNKRVDEAKKPSPEPESRRKRSASSSSGDNHPRRRAVRRSRSRSADKSSDSGRRRTKRRKPSRSPPRREQVDSKRHHSSRRPARKASSSSSERSDRNRRRVDSKHLRESRRRSRSPPPARSVSPSASVSSSSSHSNQSSSSLGD